MRSVLIGVLAIHWITVPVILQSCCGGLASDDDAYYNIDDMSITVLHPGGATTVPPSKLSDLSFSIGFQVTTAALEMMHGSALYACSPEPMISNQKISAILVTSNNDLVTSSSTISKGETLNFMFVVNTTGHYDDPLSDLIKNPLLEVDYLIFSSDVALNSDQSHTFTFKITLDDGRVFVLETETLQLLEG